ncbi:MAG: DUF4968 domain-containing protein [Propionibacteriaceae bacterium]|nr:DUF4968 domain-containing protein [Propionibacteriaceae bacterium]
MRSQPPDTPAADTDASNAADAADKGGSALAAWLDRRPTGSPLAPAGSVVAGAHYRFTVLTSRLIRMEYSPTGQFTDRATQVVLRRDLPTPEFTVTDEPDRLVIRTEHLLLDYNKRPFEPGGLTVRMRQRAQASHHTRWSYGDPDRIEGQWPNQGYYPNLGGTARTLDEADGSVPLESGVLGAAGYAVLNDDSKVVMTDDGWVEARAPQEDLYFFGYGRDYQAALRDYFALTGASPLLPRWALGNWWSRYHQYNDGLYLGLFEQFAEEDLPFSVAVLDMDWHLTEIDPELGSGWTGYTWNKDLFPDPAGFLAELHRLGLHVTLNLHPADGVRRHEAAYAYLAQELGFDPFSGVEIPLDVASPTFMKAYFEKVLHPLEDEGVDFWWVDWQSGSSSRVPGLDPLWMLNHLHYLDSARRGERPITFSRYAGPGSHRYPIGFSGDTVVSWESLRFQPFFTATAANIGYYWWSNDIGGHMFGVKDDELATRWVQFGAFSPINRLHSTNSRFNSKETWRFGPVAEKTMGEFLRLRHQIVPYLYSAMWTSHTDGVAPMRPLYHDYPEAAEAYLFPNEYFFGPDLIAAPITERTDPHTHLASTALWLPEGEWCDFFTGRPYGGDRRLMCHRTLEHMPVFARAGAIIPLTTDPTTNVGEDPDDLTFVVFPGADGDTVLFEDSGAAGVTIEDRRATGLHWRWHADLPVPRDGLAAEFVIDPPTGPGVKTRRRIRLEVRGGDFIDDVVVFRGERKGQVEVDAHRKSDGKETITALEHGSVIDLGELDLSEGITVRLGRVFPTRRVFMIEARPLLDQAEIAFLAKDQAWRSMLTGRPVEIVLAEIATLPGFPPDLLAALTELAIPGDRNADGSYKPEKR